MAPLIPGSALLEDAPAEQYLVVATDDDPAAGISVAANVPGGKTWEVVAVRLSLVTDANAANRRVHLALDDGTTEVFRIPAPAVQAASLTVVYSFVAGLGEAIDGGAGVSQAAPLPRFGIPAGFVLRTVTTNIQAGDNYARPVLLVREVPLRGEQARLMFTLDRLIERLEQLGPIYDLGGGA